MAETCICCCSLSLALSVNHTGRETKGEAFVCAIMYIGGISLSPTPHGKEHAPPLVYSYCGERAPVLQSRQGSHGR